MFYAYFFKRYTEANPDAWVLLGSFTSKLTLVRVVVKRGKRREVLNDKSSQNADKIIDVMEASDAAHQPLLMLFDGPPNYVPPLRTPSGERDVRMACFTSPNEGWFKMTESEDESTWLYMPLWTREEVGAAATALGLALDDEKLTDRFTVFGGEASMCLHLCENEVQLKKKLLQEKISGVDRSDAVVKLLSYDECEEKHNRVIHYEPDEDATYYNPRIASTFVEHMLVRSALKLTDNKKQRFIRMLAGVSEAGALRGYFFEARAHQILGCGLVTIYARPLDTDSGTEREEIKIDCSGSSEPNYFSYPPSPGCIPEGAYNVPTTKTLPAIDAFYLPKTLSEDREKKQTAQEWSQLERLLLFQMTVSMHHPVKASALVDVLAKLGLLDIVQSNPSRAALVFVVSTENEARFERQPIVGVAAEGPVEWISGVEPKRATELRAQGVMTIEQALEALQKNTLTPPQRKLVLRHRQAIECTGMLKQVPQYMWGRPERLVAMWTWWRHPRRCCVVARSFVGWLRVFGW